MSAEVVRDVLLWCSVINMGLLIFSFLMLSLARQWVYRIHSKMFPMTEPQFNTIIYSLLGAYKILVFVFNIVPYIAVRIAM
ncbi:MAG: hypothetical protein JXD22_04865 [Sedimentisphaerales bacterium]|nr:hypothetical protein [Sedimentisphaerales bacterium]